MPQTRNRNPHKATRKVRIEVTEAEMQVIRESSLEAAEIDRRFNLKHGTASGIRSGHRPWHNFAYWVFGNNGTENRLKGIGELISRDAEVGEPIDRTHMHAKDGSNRNGIKIAIIYCIKGV